MKPYPQEWEWLWVMESEPLEDDEVLLRFDTTDKDARIQLEVWPYDTEVKLTWHLGGKLSGDLALRWVSGIEVETTGGVTALKLTFEDSSLMPLRFQIRPHVTIQWGTNWYS